MVDLEHEIVLKYAKMAKFDRFFFVFGDENRRFCKLGVEAQF